MPRSNTPADFWKRVSIPDADACWLWTGPLTDRGYGKLSYLGKDMRAHQVAFLLANGYQPPATLHKCDVRKCCNPAHLFPGDNGLNNKDRAAKNRSFRPAGSLHPMSKLTESNVAEIRSSIVDKEELASKFGVTTKYIGQILRRQRWAHV